MSLSESKQHLNWIGMICRINDMPKLEEHTYSWIFRILVLDLELAKHHYKIVCYNPEDVNLEDKTVIGLILDGTKFKKVTLPLPTVNYDYYFGTPRRRANKGLRYEDFEPWATQIGYKIYPEKSLRKIANDKLTTAKLLSQWVQSLIPHTELFIKESQQIEKFLQNKPAVFLKPRFGNSGNGIFVIKKEKNSYLVDYYARGKRFSDTYSSIPQFLAELEDDYDNYIIQEAIECIRYDERVFDIRAMVFKDEKIWHFLSEVRLGAKDKAISNLSQGGDTLNTEAILHQLFPPESVFAILEKIRQSSENIAIHINNHVNDKVTEIALDILLDANKNIYIAEINIKAGLSGGFSLYDNFFNMSEQEKFIYETQAKKHGEYLAKSLLHRCQRV